VKVVSCGSFESQIGNSFKLGAARPPGSLHFIRPRAHRACVALLTTLLFLLDRYSYSASERMLGGSHVHGLRMSLMLLGARARSLDNKLVFLLVYFKNMLNKVVQFQIT
jgi:hypothetical protein